MSMFKQIMFIMMLFGVSYVCCMQTPPSAGVAPYYDDTFKQYMGNLHAVLKWSLIHAPPHKTFQTFYQWDESLTLFKELPSFDTNGKKYQLFLMECQMEIQSIMDSHQVLKEYFIKLSTQERENMRLEAQQWAANHFPYSFFAQEQQEKKKRFKSLKRLVKKMI